MTATYLHVTQTVQAPSVSGTQIASKSLVTMGPAASAWWVIKAVKITVDYAGSGTPSFNVLINGGHMITTLFFGAPNAVDLQSRVDNTFLLNDTSAILAAVVAYPGQYITAQFANSSTKNAVCTMEIYGIQYDTPPPIEALPAIAGSGFRGGLISGRDLSPTEAQFLFFDNPGPGLTVPIRVNMRDPVSLYSMSWIWGGQSIASFPGNLGNWELRDSISLVTYKTLLTDAGAITGTVGLATPINVDFGGITISEFAYVTANATSGFSDLIFHQTNGTPAAGTVQCSGTVLFSQGLNIPLY